MVQLTSLVLGGKRLDKLFDLDPKENSLSMDSVLLISCKAQLVIVGFYHRYQHLQRNDRLQIELLIQLQTALLLLKKAEFINSNSTEWENGMMS